jgi:hypothetical protein
MSLANPLWGAPRIHGELLKLGIDVGQTTVAKYKARGRRPPSQGWKTFLYNHADGIASMDLFVVPTISFRPLYGLLILRHDRRQILWLGVTAHPTAEWISRQLTEAYGWKVAPRYIIRDRDAVYGDVFIRRLRATSIRDRPTAPRSPWQNGYCERAIGSIRRECLDHVVVFGERHLAICYDLTRPTITRLDASFSQQGCPDAANSTRSWSHCAYAISWRTPSSVCACLISDRHTGFRRYWRWKSNSRAGRPRIESELRALIRQMSTENQLWGAPRSHGELLKLGFELAQSSVANGMDRPCSRLSLSET